MNKYVYIGTLVAALSAATSAMAGPGGSCHFHGSKPATESIVVDCATQRKEALVASGKLDKSWESVKVDKAELVDSKKGKEWRVTFKDSAAKDKAKETLFIIFTAPGNFIAANFTGQ